MKTKHKPIVLLIFVLFAAALLFSLQLAHYSQISQTAQPVTSAIVPNFQMSIPVTAPEPEITNTQAQLTTITYYVSPSGNDANAGTSLTAPWRTIGKAARTAQAGSQVYVRGGTYAEIVSLNLSGTSTSPIKFSAYPGETPVVDAATVSMPTWSALFSVYGNYVQVSGFEVRNSKWMGVNLRGKYITVDNFYSHHNQQNGILIAGDYDTVQNSRVYRNALSNELHKATSWASGLSAARDPSDGHTDYAVIRNNHVWENWGEGISSYEATHTLISNNQVNDNFSTNIYISDSTYVVCKSNIVYMTPTSYVNGYGSNVGIMMGDEKYNPPSAYNQVTDNLVYGNRRNFYWWQGTQGGGMNNDLIAYNTFVNSIATDGVQINSGPHQNTRFENNIIVQDGSLPAIILGTNVGITFSNNIWSKTPSSNALGVSSRVADPKLAKTGSPYAGDWYRLLDGSPSINQAKVLSEVSTDYFGAPRGTLPDIGGTEK